jgi:hypothetical protein
MNALTLTHQLMQQSGSVGDPGVRPRYVGLPAFRQNGYGGGYGPGHPEFEHRRFEEHRRMFERPAPPPPPQAYNPYGYGGQMYGQPYGLVGDPSVRPRFPGQMHGYDPFGAGGVGAPVVNHGMHPRPVMPGSREIAYHDMEYVAGDVTYFGLGITSIGPGAVIDASLKPLRPIVPQKILIPSTTTGLLVQQVSIGGTNIFANTAGVPVELFSEVSTAPQIDFPTIDTAVGIDFLLFNPTGAAINFTGAIYGTAIRR